MPTPSLEDVQEQARQLEQTILTLLAAFEARLGVTVVGLTLRRAPGDTIGGHTGAMHLTAVRAEVRVERRS